MNKTLITAMMVGMFAAGTGVAVWAGGSIMHASNVVAYDNNEIHVGDIVEIKNSGNSSVGDHWSMDSYDKNQFELVQNSYVVAKGDEKVPGSPGEFVVRLRALKPGTSEVALKYTYRGQDPRTCTYTITVH